MAAESTSQDQPVTRAREFVRAAALPEPPPMPEGALESSDDAFLDPARPQAVAVGSGVVSFMAGMEPGRRRAVADAVLLAQLVADKKVSDPDQTDAWYKAYLDVLANLGWVIEHRELTTHEASGRGVEAHEAILGLATTVLGGVPGALALVTATVNALKDLGSDRSWITLFNREQKQSRVARFQLALARDDGAACSLTLLAFSLEAGARVTQVLFVKVRLSDAELRSLSTRISIDPGMLASLQPEVEQRIVVFRKAYLRTLPNLVMPA